MTDPSASPLHAPNLSRGGSAARLQEIFFAHWICAQLLLQGVLPTSSRQMERQLEKVRLWDRNEMIHPNPQQRFGLFYRAAKNLWGKNSLQIPVALVVRLDVKKAFFCHIWLLRIAGIPSLNFEPQRFESRRRT